METILGAVISRSPSPPPIRLVTPLRTIHIPTSLFTHSYSVSIDWDNSPAPGQIASLVAAVAAESFSAVDHPRLVRACHV